MVNPEEDFATVFASYGYVSPEGLYTVSAAANSNEIEDGIKGVRQWALQAEQRVDPAPSLAPYLKLLWIEWFSQIFEPYKGEDNFAQTFVYSPITVSNVTFVSDARKRVTQGRGSPEQIRMLMLALELRDFLASRYPKD